MLHTYVAGEPKKVVEHYLLLGTDEAYIKARETLASRYGNSSVVSSAFMKKLNSWPKISDRDPSGLRSFADFLQQVSVAKMSVNSLGILDFPQENVKLLKKLPFYLERKWREEIGRWKRASHGTYPTFTKFVDFVSSAGETANIPELEGIRVEEPRVKPSSPRAKTFQGRTLSTTAEKGKEYSSCPFCSEDHHVDDCPEFDKMSYKDKKMFFFKKYLCMGCGRSSQHLVKDCKQRRRCKKCQQKHLTCLHRQQAERGTSNCTSICALPDQDGKDHCMIVPVWVRHVDDPGRESLEYAILDDQSNVGFVSESLCSTLGISGPETELMLTTMHQSTRVSCQKISGLEVLDYKKSTVIKLPPSFSRCEVPAKRSQIPKADVVEKWKHLAPIATELMPYDSSIKVSLLIGNNCPRAIRPREVLPGGEDDPYGMKTSLGWGVVGRVCQSSQRDDGAVCHRIQTSPGYPHFVVSQKAKEVFNPEKIIQVLEKDFIEVSEKGEPYSVDETKFIDILEKGIVRKPDGHYEMPLPLRSGQSVLPDNKPMAIKRWNQLTARFRRNPRFQDDYVAFMEDVITNHAEKVTTKQPHIEGRINYIPHSGVYHPRKPEKIRVVFDCSASYQGVSLNDHLLQGPNLMNSLIGVLHRFRKEEVAFATDVKSMFHQFGVSAKDRDLLRFLWYEDNDVRKEPVEYRMKVHLFGAVSSPGCANFGLKRAAADGEAEYGSDAADFIRNDFYVDDGLSSRPTPGDAVKVLQDSKAICAKAGLKLHKIVSNSRDVLRSFPVEERAKCIQELNLDVDPLALERALGVTRSTEEDTFQFHVQLEERPLNRRGVLSTIGTIYDPSGFLGPAMLKGKRILQEMCRSKLDWDTPMPDELQTQWNAWRSDISHLQDIRIPRCYKPDSFGKVKAVELHHFSDASKEGYGQCSYIRLITQPTAHWSVGNRE